MEEPQSESPSSPWAPIDDVVWAHLVDALVQEAADSFGHPHVVACLGPGGVLSLEGPFDSAMDALCAAEDAQAQAGDLTWSYVAMPIAPPST